MTRVVEEILENLVSQFTDPLTFYRELIQNALDAGSGEVRVELEQRPDGMVVIEVADSGEGMSRHIIQHELTRLFSSSKEGDLTKIGKFGIGFVSVFAIKPAMVMVDTGRDGEFWRVEFDGTPNFKVYRLDSPVEGTRVRVYKSIPASEYDDFVVRSKETISYWCRYSDTPVLFCGTPINQTLDVESPLKVRHDQPGTQVVAGLTADLPPLVGMYNRGLTLKEVRDDLYPGVTFRIKSRYLEHTLTRDNVLLDENFSKAMLIVRQVVRQQLSCELFDQVGELLETPGPRLDEIMGQAVPFLSQWRRTLSRSLLARPLFPTLHGPPLTLPDVRRVARREGSLYVEARPNRVTEQLAQHEVPVIQTRARSGMAQALAAVTGTAIHRASTAVAAPLPCPDEVPRGLQVLGPVLSGLLQLGNVPSQDVALASFQYPGSAVARRPCLVAPASGEPVRLYRRSFWHRLRTGPVRLLLNNEHPLVTEALQRAPHVPLLSAFVLAKAILLNDGLPDDLEQRILRRCLAYGDETWMEWLKRLFAHGRAS
ncbi:MAG: sacsin N-terminal ATP-binding-like domain-containing protein [Candidatus Xenobia bacterium]